MWISRISWKRAVVMGIACGALLAGLPALGDQPTRYWAKCKPSKCTPEQICGAVTSEDLLLCAEGPHGPFLPAQTYSCCCCTEGGNSRFWAVLGFAG